MKMNWKVKTWRYFIIAVIAIYLITPLYSMLDFSTKPFAFTKGSRSLEAWKVIPSQPDLGIAVFRSLVTAAIVMGIILVLIVPTLVWVHLKVPKLKRMFELICLLPLAIPAIVIVVGVAPLYRWISINLTESPIMLCFIYAILILPFTYRSLSASMDASDIHTLYEASRTLGASTPRMMVGIVMPTLRTGIMNGSFIAIALVLGEYTISNLLNFKTFQVVIAQMGRTSGTVAVAVSLASIIFVLMLLLLIPQKKQVKDVLDVDVA